MNDSISPGLTHQWQAQLEHFFSVSIQLQGTKVASNSGEGLKVAGMVMIITYSVDTVVDSIYLYMYITLYPVD